jgi:hypothetical protein
MPWWQWLVDVLAAVLLLVALYAVALVVRRRWISRAGGTFDLSLRAGELRPGRGWVLGVGRYAEDTLEFFRIFSVVPRPMDVVVRAEVEYLGQRPPEPSEASALYAGHVIVSCRRADGPIELAMAESAVTGFLAWMEAAPPGQSPRPV